MNVEAGLQVAVIKGILEIYAYITLTFLNFKRIIDGKKLLIIYF